MVSAERYAAAKKVAKKAPAKKTAKMSAPRNPALESFKQRVIDATMEHPDGCSSGRREFLEGLGLEFPVIKQKFMVEFEYSDHDEESIMEDEIRRALTAYIQFDDVKITEVANES